MHGSMNFGRYKVIVSDVVLIRSLPMDRAKPDGTSCDDGIPATVNDVCSAGACGGETTTTTTTTNPDLCTGVVCTASDVCHDIGVCSAGVCSNPVKPDFPSIAVRSAP